MVITRTHTESLAEGGLHVCMAGCSASPVGTVTFVAAAAAKMPAANSRPSTQQLQEWEHPLKMNQHVPLQAQTVAYTRWGAVEPLSGHRKRWLQQQQEQEEK